MMTVADIIEEFIVDYNWIVADITNSSDEVVMLRIKRQRINNEINKYYYSNYIELNFIIKAGMEVSIWNPHEAINACVGNFSLNSPDSLHDIGKILS